MSEPLIYEISSPGRCGVEMPASDVPETDLPKDLLRSNLGLPELSQLDVVRHYMHLSQMNYNIDGG
ncbi:MAG TPA: aminomethyl-transferring glycine dehydrogenase subunit GcvPB, partial [Anaerolineae bacterium]|nr:aminomethyl-transferring glycine dehydrogenase subunit GcvPB [Anaerolineae bacterium]